MHTEPPLSSHTNFPETKFQTYSLVNENHILNFANEFMPDVFQFLEPCTVNSLPGSISILKNLQHWHYFTQL